MGMSLATTFVLTLSSLCSYLAYATILQPLGLEYLQTITFILVIAVVVQFTEMVVKRPAPSVSGTGDLSAAHHHQLRAVRWESHC